MAYKEKTFSVKEMIQNIEADRLDMEKIEQERRLRIRLLSLLPEDLVIRGLQLFPLHGSEATIYIDLDGGTDVVTQSMLHLLEQLPPGPVENVTDSCRWFQPEGYRGERTNYDAPHVRILPVCPVWVSVSHTVKASSTHLAFEWYTTMQETSFRVKAEILQPHNWVQYRYTCGHSHGDRDVTIGSQEVGYRFVDPEIWVCGRGSSSQAWGFYFYWDHNTRPEKALRVSETWSTHRKSGGY